jgi:hypothetical protein
VGEKNIIFVIRKRTTISIKQMLSAKIPCREENQDILAPGSMCIATKKGILGVI